MAEEQDGAPETGGTDTGTDNSDAGGEPSRLPDDHPLVKAHRARKGDLADARRRLKEFEDADKSELDKVAEDRDTERTRADRAESEAARLRAAIKHGLTSDDLDLLGEGTPEEIEARAERLAKRLGDQGSSRRPAPDPSQGRRGDP